MLATSAKDGGSRSGRGVRPDPSAASVGLPQAARGIRRWVYQGLGCLCVALGALGIPLPGLPTTPFLLLASYFFLRSSPALHQRLLSSKTLGPMLQDWDRHRGVRPRVKRVAVTACAALITLSVAFGGLAWPLRLLALAAGAYGIWFVSRLPTVTGGAE